MSVIKGCLNTFAGKVRLFQIKFPGFSQHSHIKHYTELNSAPSKFMSTWNL